MRAGALAGLAFLAAGALAGPAAAVQPGPAVEITQDRTEVRTEVGERFTFSSTIRSTGEQPPGRLAAHLNILGLDPEVYVDPEDWSGERTQYLTDLRPGESRTLSWTVQAVNDGAFVVYVALASEGAGSQVAAGPGIRAEVTSRQVVNAGGILPVALGVPAGLAVLLLTTRLFRRRLR